MSALISHNAARSLIGEALFGDDWIGSLNKAEVDLLRGEHGPQRLPRPGRAVGFFEIIRPCPPNLRRQLDGAIGRDRRMIVQLTTVLEWLAQQGFNDTAEAYEEAAISAAIASSSTKTAAPSVRGKRGPQAGSIARYAAHDRSLFPQMKRLINDGLSESAAAAELAPQLKGGGTEASKATRLRKLFRKESV